MKKKVNRLLIFAIAVLMTMSLFAGCTSNQKSDGETTATTTALSNDTSKEGTTKEETPEYTGVINILAQFSGPSDPDSPIIQELEKLCNVDLNFWYVDKSKYKELLNLRIASNEIPDFMSGIDADSFVQYAEQGVLAELPLELIQENAPTLYECTVNNGGGEEIWNMSKVDGKNYGLPLFSADGVYHFPVVWRDDWLKNVGIDKIPETLEEAEEAFYRFVNDDPDQNGKDDTYAISNGGMIPVFGAFGSMPYNNSQKMVWLDKEGEVINGAVVPEMKDALTLLNKWYNDGLIDPEFITGENKGQQWANSVTFWNSKIGCTANSTFNYWRPASTGGAGGNNYVSFKEIAGENATYDFGKPLTGPNGDSGTIIWGTLNAFKAACGRDADSEPGKLEKILYINEKLLSDFDFFILSTYGFEGEHYEVDENGSYNWIGEAATLDGRAKLGMHVNGIAQLINHNFEYKYALSPKVYELGKKVARYTDNYKNVIPVSLPSALEYTADVEKIITEAYVMFITGERDVSEFEQFVEEAHKAGLEQLTKEANDWYAEYTK